VKSKVVQGGVKCPPHPTTLCCSLPGALYYFAFAHQADFDVRWCKGPIGTLMFDPLVQKLQSMGVKILGGRRVDEILPSQAQQGSAASLNPAAAAAAHGRVLAGRVVARDAQGATEVIDADAVILAAGVPALKQLVQRSQLLGSCDDLAACMGLDCSDVLAVRLWLDRKVQLPTASNVVAGFDQDVGGTLFQLDSLQVRRHGLTGSNVSMSHDRKPVLGQATMSGLYWYVTRALESSCVHPVVNGILLLA